MPGLAELDAATEHTKAVNADPEAGAYDRYWAAEQEAEAYDAAAATPEGDAAVAAFEHEMEAG